MKHLPFVFALVAAVSVSCSNQPKPTRQPIGIVELTINPQAKLTTAALLPNQDSVVFTVNTFSVTTNGNQKYLNAKFDIENRSGSSLQDLTLVAYRQANNQAGTAIKNLADFSGGSVNLDDYAKQAKPINGVNASTPITVNNDNADLQVLSEAEVSSLTTDAGSLLQSGEYLLPYGFVARANSNSRSIPTGTNAGTITVGIKVPDTNEPSTSATRFTMTFIAFTESVTSRVTESLEEQNSNPNLALLRQTAFGATDLMTIGNSLTNSSKRECSVRIAGTADNPSAYLVNTPKVTSFTPTANALNMDTNSTLTISLGRPLSSVATTDLVVHGSQTGEYAGSWSGTGSSNLTFTPSTAFKQGEQITVGLKSGTVWCEAKNWQFLTKTTTEAGFGFVARADYPIGSNPRSVALGDVNGDGKLDMVTANFGANNVSLLLGDGTGGFGPKTDFATGSSPNSVALGDVNGDGKPDIVTANSGSGNSSVLLGNGNGTFQTKTDFTVGSQPWSVALGDVNADGKLDIVTANSNANTSGVLLGNGTGGFGTRTEFTTGTQPRSVALGDVNSDGKLDLVTANRGANTSSVLLGNGSGGFGAKSDFATGAEPYSVALGDVNGDGKLDVVTANNATSGTTASVLLGNGDGTLQAKTDVTVGSQPISVALGDVSGDGRLDIVAANLAGASTSVLLGNGDGTFQAKTDFIVGSQPWSVALGDVNGDGKLDIVTANMALGAYQSSVLLGNGSGGFATRTDFATGSQPRSVALGDVNGDGNLDVVTANTGSGANSASVLLGNGSGGFGTKTDFATGSQPFSVSLGDVNSDGKLDLVTANNGFGANSASVLLGNGDGTFQAKTDFATGTGPTFVALGDVSGDGKLDLVTANSGFSSVNSVSVLLGNGDGTFRAKTDFSTGSSPTSVAIGDVNDDGKLDLVTANSASGTNSASVLLGNGSGGFGAKTDFTTGTQPRSVALGDVNSDGKLDIVTANNGTSSSSVLLGDGTGGFGTRTNFATGFNPSSVALGDVNGDGKLDIVTANHGNGSSIDTSTVLFGNGSGGFPIRTDFATGSQPRFAALGDVNSDGKLDLVTANNGFGANSISQLLKR